MRLRLCFRSTIGANPIETAIEVYPESQSTSLAQRYFGRDVVINPHAVFLVEAQVSVVKSVSAIYRDLGNEEKTLAKLGEIAEKCGFSHETVSSGGFRIIDNDSLPRFVEALMKAAVSARIRVNQRNVAKRLREQGIVA